MRLFLNVFMLVMLGCDETKIEDSNVEDTQDVQSAYGTCSLDLVAASGYDYTASSSGAASVVIHLAYIDDTYGVQEEDHPLALTESGTWSLELEYANSPQEVVLGQSTMWSVTGFVSGDRIFLGLTEDGAVCDCWDTDSYDVVLKDCSAFVEE